MVPLVLLGMLLLVLALAGLLDAHAVMDGGMTRPVLLA
jgi:hypothetical protein